MGYTFKDFYHNTVQLSFGQMPFSKTPKHVWVICQHHTNWLLTTHPERGIEFPGGKVEDGETAEEAARREVMEETGGMIKEMEYIAQYRVIGRKDTIIKNVYYAKIDHLTDAHVTFETMGPLLLSKLPSDFPNQRQYSFMMKDDVLKHCLQYLSKTKKLSQD